MTFSYRIKEEISKLECSKIEYISELSGILCTSSDLKLYSIKVQTENINAANRIFDIVHDNYSVTSNIAVKKNYNFKKNEMYVIEVKKDVPEILKDLGLIGDNSFKISNYPTSEIVDDEELKAAFIRGCFLIGGSVNDPKTSRYHLEFIINNEEFANFLKDILNSYELNAKTLRRAKGYMVYIKESEKISDLLRVIKAYNAVLYYEDIRVLREKQNMNNRINNCEQANIEKSMNSSNKQIEDINFIKVEDAYDLLDEKVRKVADYRLKYPESSLIELSNIISVETGEKIISSIEKGMA